MPRKEVFNLTIDVGANISQAQSAAKSLQEAFSKVNLTEGIKKGLDKTFGDLEKELNNFASMTSKPFTDMKDIQKAEKSFEKINDLLNDLQVQGKTIAGMDLSKFLPNDTVNKVKAINDQIKDFKKTIDGFNNQKLGILDDISKLRKEIDDTDNKIKRLKIGKTEDTLSDSEQRKLQQYQFDIQRATEKIAELETEMKKVNNQSQEFSQQGLLEIKRAFAEVAGIKVQQVPRTIEGIQEELSKLTAKQIEEVKKALESGTPAAQKLAEALGLIKPPLDAAEQEAGELSEVAKEVERLGNQVKQFFSIGNTIQLFKRAVRDAMATVKELDATMTETATVTDFSISDMWEQLPRYTDEANKLGTSINSLYKATTLYYQQGLQTNEAMALGIETIKMARVANMDAALATDLMTAALRGFNMELNEMSAVRINDVYSELAAVTAADTDEIGIAISKTASIAHSANMEFETTAAFLSQIIETTREAPETAGTAMKTIIARFSEVKKLYSEGQILGTDEEGEAINVNKIQEALRTVGIDMTKFFVGAEGLDDVLLRLAQKWDTLDVATQRYIATQAAGSRQQSRFLAMMSDYDRTMELVNAAYDSAGSGQAQFEKTLDSMQAKLTELKNAWDQFVMGLANNEILKFGVDTLTSILSTINDIISAVSGNNGLVKSILSLGSAFLALRGGAKLFGSGDKTGWFQKILGITKGKEKEFKKTGIQIGTEIGKSIGTGISNSKEGIKNSLSSLFSKESWANIIKGPFENSKKLFESINEVTYKDMYAAMKEMNFSNEQEHKITTIWNTEGKDAAIKALEDYYNKIQGVEEKQKQWEDSSKQVGQALIGIGTAIILVGSLISKENEEAGKIVTTIGYVISGLGGVISVIPGVVSGIKAISAALSVSSGVIGIVIALIGLLIGGFIALANNTPEKKLEAATKKAKEAQQAAREAQQAYDDLLKGTNEYTELEKKVDTLTKGTNEWAEAVGQLNDKVLELVETYDGLEFNFDAETRTYRLTEDSIKKVTEQSKKEATDKNIDSLMADLGVAKAQVGVAKSSGDNLFKDVSGKNVTGDQITKEWQEYFEGLSPADQSYVSFDSWLKEQGYTETAEVVYSVDINQSEKNADIARKNLVKYLVPNDKEKNEIADAINNVYNDSIDELQEKGDKEGLKTLVQDFTKEYNSLSPDEKALLSGNFSAIAFENFNFNNVQNKDVKEALEKQRREYEKALKDTRNELQRLTGVYSTDFGFFNLDKGSALKLTEKTSKMGKQSAQAYYKAWDDIRKRNPNLASNLLNFEVNNINDLTSIIKIMREAGAGVQEIENYWKAAVAGAENYEIKLSDILNRGTALRDSIKNINELIERAGSGTLTQEDVERILGAGFDTSNLQQTAEGWQLIGISIEEVRRALNGDLAEEEAITTDIIKEQILETQKELDKLANISSSDIAGIARREYLTNQLSELEKSYTFAEKNEALAEASKYTAQENEVRGGSEESIIYSAQNEAQRAGYDTEELDAYALSLQGINQNLQNNKATAYEVALSNMNLNAGLDEIIGSYNDWVGLIDQESGLIKATTSDDAKAYNDLRDSVNKMLNASEDLSDEFWNNAKNIENIKKAAEGDTKALGELQVAAAQDYLINLGLDPEAQNIVNDFANELENWDLPPLEAGVELTGQDDFIAACQQMIDASHMTADQVSEYFKRLGYDVEFDGDPQTVTQTRSYPETSYTIEYDDQGNMSKMTPHTEMVPVTWKEDIMAPTIKTLTSTGSGGGGVSTKNLSGGKGNANKGKKGGGGGGGSSKKQNNWKNPYDKYYNLTEKINEALRTREKIERDYDRILKRRERTAAELLKNSAQEIANLRQEIVYQQRLQAGRREQIQNLAKERYDNGDQRTTFEQMGVTKYANYNFDTQTIEIDWAAIEAVRDEELGKAIEAYVGRLEELQGQYEDTQTTIEDMEDQIWEINQRGKEEYLNFESRIIDALINADQKLIDDLSAKFDSINEANSRVLSSMQESIDLERQIRDNTKTEDDIASKEARLAYLRRDTSGANQMEIMKLEQDLADARQNYSDQLIDQGMQKLSDENEKASQQRQEQIDIMQAIHDWTVQSGGFNATAERLINETAAAGEVTEEVKKLLQDNEGWTSMTKFAGEDWMTKLANEYKAAMEGLSNFKEESARLEYSKSKPLTLETGEKVWFDDTLGRWVDAANNLYDIQYNTATGGYTRVSVTSSNEADPNAWLKDYLDKMIAALGDKDSGTPSSGSGGNGGSSGSSSSGSGSKTHAPTPTRYKYYAVIANEKFDKGGFSSKSEAMTKLLAAIKTRRNQLSEKFGNTNDPTLLDKITKLDNYIHGKIPLSGYIHSYKTGGLNTQTGLAWLDGTASHPELVLNARDTENFIQLKDILSDMGSLDKLQNGGDNYYNFDIKVDQLANDYDVDKLIGKIKNEITKDAVYRNTNAIHLIR